MNDEWQPRGLCRGNHAHLFFPPPTFERKDGLRRTLTLPWFERKDDRERR